MSSCDIFTFTLMQQQCKNIKKVFAIFRCIRYTKYQIVVLLFDALLPDIVYSSQRKHRIVVFM